MKSPLYVKTAARLILVISGIVVFFIIYNNFLLDKSLAALDASLNTLKASDSAAVGLLLNIKAADEITKENFNDGLVAGLDYLNTVIAQRPDSDDAQIILSNLINSSKDQRPPLLNMLDSSSIKIKQILQGVIAPAAKAKQLQAIEAIKQAIKAHTAGDFLKAKELYQQAIKNAPDVNYAYVANGLLTELEQQIALENKRDEIRNALKSITDQNKILVDYIELGLIEIQLLNYAAADECFNKVIETAPQSDTAVKAKFYLGWSSKQQGDLDKSLKNFEEIENLPSNEKFYLSTKLQVADVFKKKGDYEKAARMYRDLSKEKQAQPVADVSLALASFTYLFDLNDADTANEIAAELIKSYPASKLLEATRVKLKGKPGALKQLTEGDEGKEGNLAKMWTTTPILKQASAAAEEVAACYAVYMIEGSIKSALTQNLQKDDIFTTDLDSEFLNNYVKKRLQQVASKTGAVLSGFTITFPQKDRISVSGYLQIGPKNFKFQVTGEMKLDKRKIMDYIKNEYTPQDWITFTIINGEFGPFKIPTELFNKVLGKAHRIFNQKQVFKIDNFSLQNGRIFMSGALRFSPEELKRQQNMLDEYVRLYK